MIICVLGLTADTHKSYAYN